MRIRTPLLTTFIALGLAAPALTAPQAGATTSPSPMLAQARTISAGSLHSVVLDANGVAYGTGHNSDGQLTGAGDKFTLTPMTGLPTDIKATAVATGRANSLVLGSNGIAYGTGNNAYGQLTGAGNKNTLTPMTGLPTDIKATAIAAGGFKTLVLGSNGIAYGSGSNYNGQLTGTGTGDRFTLTPLTGLPTDIKATAVAAGNGHSLVLGSNGIVYGTGNNDYGQLTGTGNKNTLTPMTGLPTDIKATAIAAGGYHSLVLGSDQKAYGAGRNAQGQLTGSGNRATLTPLTGLPASFKVAAVSGGEDHSLVLDSAGSIYGTGGGIDGQLTGTGDANKLSRVAGPNDTGVEIAAGRSVTLVRTRDGLINGTGLGGYGQITGTQNRDLLTLLTGQRIASITPPRITGTRKVRHTLKATQGTWSPGPSTYAYQWYRGSKKISKATKSSYKLKSTDKGKKIRVRVTAKRTGVATAFRYSSYTAKIR